VEFLHLRTEAPLDGSEQAFFGNLGAKAGVSIVQAENQGGGVGQIEQRAHPERVNELAGPEVANFVHVEC